MIIPRSAKDRTGVQQAFDELTAKIFETPDLVAPGRATSGGIHLGAPAAGNSDGSPCGAC